MVTQTPDQRGVSKFRFRHFSEVRVVNSTAAFDRRGVHLRPPGPRRAQMSDPLAHSWIESSRHNPGTLGTCFPGAPDTIRTCDLCLSGLAVDQRTGLWLVGSSLPSA